MDIAELLAFSVKNKASDLHLSAGLPPMIRVHGDVRRINVPALEPVIDALRLQRVHFACAARGAGAGRTSGRGVTNRNHSRP